MITQRDIAERLGVSVTLVSRVLSGKARDIGVSATTEQEIQKTAQALGYRPSYHARALRGAPSRLVGVAVHDFEDPFFGHVIHTLQKDAAKQEVSLLLTAADNAPYDHFLQQGISRLIVLGSSLDNGWLDAWEPIGIPLIQVGRGPDDPRLHRIQVDEENAFEQLIKHLLQMGLTSAAYIGPATTVRGKRLGAFQKAAGHTSLNLHTSPAYTTQGVALDDGVQVIHQVFQKHPENLPEALVCANDQLAIGVLHACRTHGLHVPNDLRVTGFDDIPLARYTDPPLTTLRQPISAMLEKILTPLEETTQPIATFPADLIIRNSC